MEKSDIKQCHRFIRIQNQSHAQTSREWNLWTPHASKQLEVVTGFTPVVIQCIHQTQGSLTYQMPVSFSKEHVIY